MEQPQVNHTSDVDVERDGSTQQPSSSSNNVTNTNGSYNRRRILFTFHQTNLLVKFSFITQIIASAVILGVTWHKKPPILLVGWIIAYTIACIAWLPLVFSNSYDNIVRASSNAFPFSVLHTIARLFEVNQALFHHQVFPVINRSVEWYKFSLDMYSVVLLVSIVPVGANLGPPPLGTLHLYRLFVAYAFFTFISCSWVLLEIFMLLALFAWAILLSCFGCNTPTLGSLDNLTRNRDVVSNPNQTMTVSVHQTDSLPTYKYTKHDCIGGASRGVVAQGTDVERSISGDDAICCICLGTYLNNDELKELPCSHLFHSYCVDKWLKINALCPLCKHELGRSN